MTNTLPLAETARYLVNLARKLSNESAFMASVLDAYQKQERLDDATLAVHLSTNLAQLTRLALCKRPQADSSNFPAQVRQLAEFTGADPIALAQIIRQVAALEQMHHLPAQVAANSEAQPLRSRSGLMAAARDREEAESEPKPDDDGPKASNETNC
jgi:hypothetical protein